MRFTIGNKMIAGFLIIAFILGIVSALSYHYLQKIDDSYADLVNRREKILATSKDMRADTLQQMSSLRDYLLTQNQDSLDRFNQAGKQLTERSGFMVTLIKRDVDKEQVNKLHDLNQQFKKEAEQVLALIGSNKEAAVKSSSGVIQLGRDMENLANSIADGQQKLVDESSTATSAMVETIKKMILIMSIAAFIMAVLIGFLISKIISKPTVQLANAAKQIAAGDLTVKEIVVKNRDEVGDLAYSFNQMVRNLRELIAQTTISAEHVAASSEELKASAQRTNIATEQIASAIQQVAAGSGKQVQSIGESVQAVGEMSAGAQQIAVNAQNVSSSASEAAEKSTEGSQDIQRVTEQMNSIHLTMERLSEVVVHLETRSQDIGEIVKIISDISARTNLLALNASIEAARAGEQGKGFAVVAGEIRKLAEQSSQSSQQIADLIAAIQEETNKAALSMESGIKEVDEGIHVVSKAGTSFEHIDQAVHKVLTQIQEVAAAAQEMSASTEQVSAFMKFIAAIAEESESGIRHVSASTQEQLASSEEVSTFASSLAQMAEQLQFQIVKFKV
ncbi:methyl-accepting chemotaxis protein [Paenibacillus thalictri]|uniref:Methyl-accepting chemotaxis protein n=1 Tax=Paenibacillus thalictri TaxID=2527873 RepID=A0A4Q9DUX6_9BACL|nr:methyl-accepting chemotaxis protein [Paenibacillus thalictri]TBL79378.1 methyl-accepting chemotaxis protein [Paenibacillus thalictri]